MTLVVGVDAGGTSTRAIAVDSAGVVHGTGTAAGANPNSHPPAEAAARIAGAIEHALAGERDVAGVVVGMAGESKLSDPAVAAEFSAAWERIGLSGRVRTVNDAEVAYASATSEPDGTVLVAGTGSIAGRVRDRRMVRSSGGHGWLLGDEGSGFWLGREAVRATLAALEGDGPLDGLPEAVLAEAFGPSGVDLSDRAAAMWALVTRANAEPPIRLARYAPFVSAAAAAGEPGATEIVARGATELVRVARATREPGEKTPVVLVGSVLAEDSPVGTRVRAEFAGLTVLTSSDGVLGAAWLAAVDAWGEDTPRPSRRVNATKT
ncbi:N-acetylglucosamine kinase [Amycolatopsis benzoatilytica]|uniref:N-acetylglucosamine kinase n=1 Tax=Amycolatopsis benzoatilytica TaxID=346045 RepID=UPI00035C15F8|nr:BadF/BadG/BcrA/BcrD ATPase family protein [Amycolatopsis benzoatilytica]